MPDAKIIITREDLGSRRVDNRIREQQAMERNRVYAAIQEDALPVASPTRAGFWRSAVVVMALFGLLGGLLAWSGGLLLDMSLTRTDGRWLGYDASAKATADSLVQDLRRIDLDREIGQYTAPQAQMADAHVRQIGRGNPYFVLATDASLSDAQRAARREQLEVNDRQAAFIIDVLGYGVCGTMIAFCLAIAEPLTQRKFFASAMIGIFGAVLGLLGGLAAALLAGRIADFANQAVEGQAQWVHQIVRLVAVWGALGLFLGLASGLVMRNWKKLLIGLLGGLLGGAVGGALMHPLQNWADHPQIARLVAMVAIGIIAGAGTGLIEHAARSGWLKVTTGIIAGKQFILYRNPTYIGSSPDCQIYLFKDTKVGKRHAAIHLTPTGIEIEDLPLGAPTFVNGKSVTRSPLKNGDRVSIGATQFQFHEKRPSIR
jgi:type III secretion system (T3SS) inner membrane Yop/YscD-like protein